MGYLEFISSAGKDGGERERERERKRESECVCVCVCRGEKESKVNII